MTLLEVNNLEKSLGGQPVLMGASLQLAAGERVGLVGRNGCGKSTLLKVLTGLLPPDRGTVAWFCHGHGYLSQEGHWDPDIPLIDQVGPVSEELLGRCGVTAEMLQRPAGRLSGGQRVRAALAQVLAGTPDALLLDEPTNHLDAQGLEWLESMLVSYPGGLLVVSHDRYFLDRVATRIVEMEAGVLTSYPGNYEAYSRQKQAELGRAESEYANYQRQKKQLQEAIQRQRQWATTANEMKLPSELKLSKAFYKSKAKAGMSRVKDMEKRLERMKVDKPRHPDEVRLGLAAGRSGRDVVLANNLGFTYDGDNWLFRHTHFFVQRSDRLAIVGPNGSGKSTLLKLFLGRLRPSEGSLYVAPRRLVYLAQELESLHPENTVLQEATGNSAADQAAARSLLGCLLFYRDDVEKRVRVLSKGEKIRLALAKALVSAPDLLVLDEPTEGLDLPSRERVDEALADYAGTLILVSHDRYLLRRVTNRVIAIDGGRLEYFPGGYEEFAGQNALTEAGSAGRRRTQERRLVLETRLARLGAALASPRPAERAALEEEFLRLSRELRELEET